MTQAKASTTTGQNNIAHYTLVLRGHLGCVILQSFVKEIQKKYFQIVPKLTKLVSFLSKLLVRLMKIDFEFQKDVLIFKLYLRHKSLQ